MKMSIRPIVQEDFRNIQLLARKSWHMAYKELIPSKVQINYLERAYHPSMLEKRMRHSLFLVAVYNESIIGFINLSHRRECGIAELSAIYLDPDYIGRKIGTALLNEAIACVGHITKIYVTVESDNQIGRKFYEAKGFKVVKEFDEDFDGHLLKSVRMVLKQPCL